MFDSEKKLFLLDGMALTYRAHFALIRSPQYNTDGLCTSAVMGMANTLLDLINRHQPTHLACVFDTSEPTSRHKEFPAYKAQRDALPEDIALQLPFIERLLAGFKIPVIKLPGYEADDIIGTLSVEAEKNGFQTWMVTPDKDYDQLVTENVFVLRPGRKGSEQVEIGVAEVLEKWQIKRIEQVIDILGLMGDASDNIPGIPGIGPKTAQKLIATYDSVEQLLDNADQLKGKQKERVQQNNDQALLSKRLVTIQLDVPHDVRLDELKCQPRDDDKLKQLFMEMEFESLGKRLFGKSYSSASTRQAKIRENREKEIQGELFGNVPLSEKSLNNVPHQYTIIKTESERQELLDTLLQQKSVCFDTETTGLDPREATPLGIAFSYQPHVASYVVCPENQEQAAAVLDQFRPLFESKTIEKIGHNLKYDVSVLKWRGVQVCGPLFDTMLAHSMKEPEMRHGLDYLAKLYLGYSPISITDLIGKKDDQQISLLEVPLEKVAEYACEDADVTFQVAEIVRADIEKQGGSEVCNQVECPLVPVLVDMEYEGIRLDVKSLEKYSIQLEDEIDSLRKSIFEAAGHEFNIESPKQLGVVLFDELQLEANPKKTATGQYSTRESELVRLSGKHKVISDVLEFRNAVKLKSVYVDQLPGHVHPRTGRLHTHYLQTWTATGRMQSNSPNLQTIPIRKQRGKEIRAAFVARDDDHLLLAADYSQIELRVMAELSGDAGMLDAFQKEIDIHRVTASKVYKVALEEVTREMRDKAKTVNFGIIYGISAFGLQQRLNIPRQEANDLIENYFEKYPGVRKYIDETISFAKENGFVQTQTGRRRYLRDINSRSRSLANAAERLAMNSPIQGTAADMLKLAMIKVHQVLDKHQLQTKMLLTVHDELVFDMPKNEEEKVKPLISQAMQNALPMSVPIVVEMGVGENWLKAH
jgi:DNA polymerase I